jgi:hypothetical protein
MKERTARRAGIFQRTRSTTGARWNELARPVAKFSFSGAACGALAEALS